jgi:peptidoglycan/xylan/chitin deacetylase (PgdA/CDA1 family)
MNIRSRLGSLRRRVLTGFHRREVPLHGDGPIVTFTFDDFPRTALTVGAEILERFGARGTYYVAASLVDTDSNSGDRFHREDLVALLDRGHEVASHTFSHVSARRVDFRTFEDDVRRGSKAIRESLGVAVSGNFSYPYGEVTLAAKKQLGPSLTSSRGTCGGLNGPRVDLNLLRANGLYGDFDNFPRVQKLISENKQRRTWLIFYSHDIRPMPSRFGCTPELFESAVSFASSMGCRMLTVAAVVGELLALDLKANRKPERALEQRGSQCS